MAPLTRDPEEFLKLAEERPAEEGYCAFQSRMGINRGSVNVWRMTVPGFRSAEAAMKNRLEREKISKKKQAVREVKESGLKQEAQKLIERRSALEVLKRHAEQLKGTDAGDGKVTEHQESFLRAMEESDDRVQALSLAGVTWPEVQAWARECKAFHARYLGIMSKWVIGVEDATMRKAKSGNMKAAQMYLQAHDPARYSPRVKVEHSGTVAITAEGVERQRNQWLAHFADGDRVLDAVEVPNAP